ncbi:hypothetical protein AVEN_164263-1 [Araneus ventricosus]|uniref:Uncharacterized protein n=1 Tax=Araneus ventricosus TaxID=182803 RepID=A0A4Y2I2X4_ARAVE|nr:hypothetical protein AVEN_164263-1 [Araneus ventricosus]
MGKTARNLKHDITWRKCTFRKTVLDECCYPYEMRAKKRSFAMLLVKVKKKTKEVRDEIPWKCETSLSNHRKVPVRVKGHPICHLKWRFGTFSRLKTEENSCRTPFLRFTS